MSKLINIKFEDVSAREYPDFCDAFVSYAEHEDETPLTEKELEKIDAHDYWDEMYQTLIP